MFVSRFVLKGFFGVVRETKLTIPAGIFDSKK